MKNILIIIVSRTGDTLAAMAELDLFVGVDTGPTHMMSTFDIPMVVLFPSVHPLEMWAHWIIHAIFQLILWIQTVMNTVRCLRFQLQML